MISISGNWIGQYRAVLRRAGLHRSAAIASAIRCDATPVQLTLSAGDSRVGVELRIPGTFTPGEFLLPQEALAVSGLKRNEQVQFLPGEDQVRVTWTDRGIPRNRSFSVDQNCQPPVFSASPLWEENEPGFLAAFHDAMLTTDPNSTRYALGCVQLRGATGIMNATDGGQLLRQTGFRFPWQEDVLVPRSLVCGCRELPQDQPVLVGLCSGWLTLQTGAWTIRLATQSEGRFPNVASVIPSTAEITTRLQLDPRDATFLAQTLARLPDPDPLNHPVTMDLNGHVAVRSRDADEPTVTELVLQHSERQGPPVRLSLNRQYLFRAMELGFREVAICSPDRPMVCDDGRRQFVWGVLDKSATLPPSNAATTISSPDVDTPDRSRSLTVAAVSLDSGAPEPVNRIATVSITSDRSRPEIDLISQVEAVRNGLRTTLQSVSTLLTAVRQQRKQSRLMKSTLASLKQLQTLRLE